MNTESTLAVIVGIIGLVSIILLLNPPTSGAVAACPGGQMVIMGGGQYSAQCMNPGSTESPGMFLRRQEMDYRRYAIAQREWDYSEPGYPEHFVYP